MSMHDVCRCPLVSSSNAENASVDPAETVGAVKSKSRRKRISTYNAAASLMCVGPCTPIQAVPPHQLSPVTPLEAARTCQLPSVSLCAVDDLDWSSQDLAVLGLLFGPLWEKVKQCEASSRPINFKTANMQNLFKSSWRTLWFQETNYAWRL